MNQQKLIIRPARVTDAMGIKDLIDAAAAKDEVLPRTTGEVFSRIREFLVAEAPGEGVVGCAALRVFSSDLAEVRSLVVSPEFRSHRLGVRLTQAVIEDARKLEVARVFALTSIPKFFSKLGFTEVPKEALPLKVWSDCLQCPKYYHCDEIALVMDLE